MEYLETMEAYLDNSATTRCFSGVTDLMVRVMQEDYGNPSAMHMKGVEAEKYIKEAKSKIAKTLKAQEKEILFTSGGTESNNLAILGTVMANKRVGKHLITTAVEHASVKNTMNFLAEQGYEITYLSVDKDGKISLDELKEAVRKDTVLVSMMFVNNEIGAVEPVEEAAKIIKEKNPNTVFHVDAIQAYGKYRIYPKRLGIDLMSVSGHKIHGPKGIGFLYIKDKTKIKPIIFGGGQQNGMRSGTENVPGAAGLGEAAFEIYEHFDEDHEKLRALKSALLTGIAQIEGTSVNGRSGEDSAPQIVSVSFQDVRSEVLLHSLEEKGVYVSAGSACASNHPSLSSTLKAIGLKQDLLDCTIRFSFSVETTMEEVLYAVECLKEIVPFRRKFVRH